MTIRMAFENKYGPVQSGVTRNVSRNGMLVQITPSNGGIAPDTGDQLSVEMELPAGNSTAPRLLSCSGCVTRVDRPRDGVVLIALEISRLRFRAASEMIEQNGNRTFEFAPFLM